MSNLRKTTPVWPDDTQLFEGEFNRWVVNAIAERLSTKNIPYVLISPEQRDVSLKTRVERANKYAAQACIYVSVHANAGGGKGFEVFSSEGTTLSDKLAHYCGEEFKKEFPERSLRADLRDGDYDKDKNFYVLMHTKMPAVLTENFFMDNEEECKNILMKPEGRGKIADFHVRGIERFIENH